MTPGAARVLAKLLQKKRGISIHDFPVGFRLAARIHELRSECRKNIITVKEEFARYILMPDKRNG